MLEGFFYIIFIMAGISSIMFGVLVQNRHFSEKYIKWGAGLVGLKPEITENVIHLYRLMGVFAIVFGVTWLFIILWGTLASRA